MGHSTQPVVSWDIALVKYANIPWNLWDIMGYMTLFADACDPTGMQLKLLMVMMSELMVY